ncbi:hypothetical protein [Marinicellulosiphila megalodicopiae]|uniref:hypothetical protein n=1 Tax=Marinicellulosiphila megalodicopiae TaxID=2724896 RepID=UPI003BB105F1
MKLSIFLIPILFLASCSFIPVSSSQHYKSDEVKSAEFATITTETSFSQRIDISEAMSKKLTHYDVTLVKNPIITKINDMPYKNKNGKTKDAFKSRFNLDVPIGETSITHANKNYYFELTKDHVYVVMNIYYDSSTGISSYTSRSTTFRTKWKSQFIVFDLTDNKLVDIRVVRSSSDI